MNKKIFIFMCLSLILLTGCKSKEENYSKYEMHIYDDSFHHTEEVVASYDSKGELKKLEMYMVYDERTDKNICDETLKSYENGEYPDLEYSGVEAKCTVDSNGQKHYFSMTDESIKAGYLEDKDEARLPFEYIYEYVKDEEAAKVYFNQQLESAKELGIEFDDKNYIVIDGERVK